MRYDEKKISDKIRFERRTKNITKTIIYIVLVVIFLINLILLFQNITNMNGKQRFFNIYFFNIISRKYEADFE